MGTYSSIVHTPQKWQNNNFPFPSNSSKCNPTFRGKDIQDVSNLSVSVAEKYTLLGGLLFQPTI